MSNHDKMELDLLEAYRKIRGRIAPEWAVHKITPEYSEELVVPTIPFVGTHYGEQNKRILVYASAENLANYCTGRSTDRPWLDDDAQAENRHRKCFDNQEMQEKQANPVIPYVHCGPMETGLLLTAVMYIAEKLRIMNMDGLTPRDFCEYICFGNYGKYSKETPYQFAKRKGVSREQAKRINIDYAGNETLMSASNEYIKADIDILRPDYIILPASMYKAAKSFIDEIKGTAVIIPIQQMLAGNVHNHIAPNGRNHREYRKYQVEELHPAVRASYNGLTTVAMDKYLYVFGYLDAVLNSFTDTYFLS